MNSETKQELIRAGIVLALIGAQVFAFNQSAQITVKAWLRKLDAALFPRPPLQAEPSDADVRAVIDAAEEATRSGS